jgi:hypothetical protein
MSFDDAEIGNIVDATLQMRRWDDDAPGVVAIAIGRVDLSICVLRFPRDEPPAIEAWKCAPLAVVSPSCVLDFFESHGFFNADYRGPFDVVVQRQLAANYYAVKIQAYSEMLFLSRGWRVFKGEPREAFEGAIKLGLAERADAYAEKTLLQKKQLLEETAQKFLDLDRGNALEWGHFFDVAPHRDELAESLMHGLTHMCKLRV